MNESVNDEGVCRTAPATPGLLINSSQYALNNKFFVASHRRGGFWFSEL